MTYSGFTILPFNLDAIGSGPLGSCPVREAGWNQAAATAAPQTKCARQALVVSDPGCRWDVEQSLEDIRQLQEETDLLIVSDEDTADHTSASEMLKAAEAVTTPPAFMTCIASCKSVIGSTWPPYSCLSKPHSSMKRLSHGAQRDMRL